MDPELGDVADKNGVWLIRGEFAVKFIVSDVADRPSVGNIGPTLADLGSKTHLAHEFVDEFVVDHPALVTQVKEYSPVAVAMLVAFEAFPDGIFKRGVLIRLAKAFLVVEEG